MDQREALMSVLGRLTKLQLANVVADLIIGRPICDVKLTKLQLANVVADLIIGRPIKLDALSQVFDSDGKPTGRQVCPHNEDPVTCEDCFQASRLCPHDMAPHECEDCMRESDHLADVAQETRAFRGS